MFLLWLLRNASAEYKGFFKKKKLSLSFVY